MEEVQMFSSFEEMMDAVSAASTAAIARMSDAQRELCDGQEHYAFYIDAASLPYEPAIGVCRIRSRQEILDGEYPEEVDLWFDDTGRASRGYLPCETNDSHYYPDEPDLHDRHASILVEISKEDFEGMKAHGWSFAELAKVPYYRRLLRLYATIMVVTADGDDG